MTNPICPYCGNEKDRFLLPDGDWFWHCEGCEVARQMQEEFDTWGQQLEREKIEHDRLTRQDYDDLLDNLANWDEEPPEDTTV